MLHAPISLAATRLAYDPQAINAVKKGLPLDPLAAQLMKDIAAHKSHSRFLPIGECQ
ncbi:hypothetical protein Q9L58_010683, partial [Maublancomyces gigas]